MFNGKEINFETEKVSIEEKLNERSELLDKLFKEELEYYKLKEENRKARAARGLPW